MKVTKTKVTVLNFLQLTDVEASIIKAALSTAAIPAIKEELTAMGLAGEKMPVEDVVDRLYDNLLDNGVM